MADEVKYKVLGDVNFQGAQLFDSIDPADVPTPASGKFAVFNDSTNNNVLSIKDEDGNVAVLILSDFYIDAGAMVPKTTGGAETGTMETVTNAINVDYFDFDPDTEEGAQFKFAVSKRLINGKIKAQFLWTNSDTAGSGDVVWGIKAVGCGNDDVLDASFGTEQEVTDTFLGEGKTCITSETGLITIGGSPASGDLAIFEVYRNATSEDDTYTQDARLLGINLLF